MDNWWAQQDQDDAWIQNQLEEEAQYLDSEMDMFNNAMMVIIQARKDDGHE